LKPFVKTPSTLQNAELWLNDKYHVILREGEKGEEPDDAVALQSVKVMVEHIEIHKKLTELKAFFTFIDSDSIHEASL